MKQHQKEQLLNAIDHKIGMVKTFYKNISGSEDLISIYEDFRKEGSTYTEIKLFLDDLNLFLESVQ